MNELAVVLVVSFVVFSIFLVACLCVFFYLCGYEKSMREEIEFLEILDRLESVKEAVDGELDS